jgi:hypothetical protein
MIRACYRVPATARLLPRACYRAPATARLLWVIAQYNKTNEDCR